MAEYSLPRWVVDRLNAAGWKTRSGELALGESYVRDGVLITVNVGRSREAFVVSYRKLSTVWNRLLDTNQLNELIDKGEIK